MILNQLINHFKPSLNTININNTIIYHGLLTTNQFNTIITVITETKLLNGFKIRVIQNQKLNITFQLSPQNNHKKILNPLNFEINIFETKNNDTYIEIINQNSYNDYPKALFNSRKLLIFINQIINDSQYTLLSTYNTKKGSLSINNDNTKSPNYKHKSIINEHMERFNKIIKYTNFY